MDTWLWLLAFIIILFILNLAVRIIKNPNGMWQHQRKQPQYFYTTKKHLMTAAEEKFFITLCEIFEHKFYVIPQVHLSALFNHKVKGQNWRGAFQHINGKSVDFVLCRKSDLSPVCGVELDDYSHDSPERVGRDAEVERIFSDAKFPLARIKNPDSLTKQELIDEFAQVIQAAIAT